MYPELNPLRYMAIVFGFMVGFCCLLPFMLGNGFDYVIWIAYPLIALVLSYPVGFHLAWEWQMWAESRKFRKQLELEDDAVTSE